MALPHVASRAEWLAARKELLAAEKALTRQRDAVSTQRRRLPMVRIDKAYRFTGAAGEVSLAELFAGRRQLIIYHFMFNPQWEKGCTGCTGYVDERAKGEWEHLAARDTTFVMVSRAPYQKLAAYAAERGWWMPWFSSHGSDFNYDFGVTVDERVGATTYNYRTQAEHEAAGSAYYLEGERPIEEHGISTFLTDDGTVFHTYSSFGRGTEWATGALGLLDLTALGRQEAWEEPKGRSDRSLPADPSFAA